VVYLFERQNEAFHVEVRRDASDRFQIVCRWPDGKTTQETFVGEASFRSRLDEIRTQLEQDAWHTAGPRLLTDRWII
jgi:hypothetical protein